MKAKSDWSVQEALNFANTLANHGWTREANADAASSCIYSLCRQLKERDNEVRLSNCAKMREALKSCVDEMCNRCREIAAVCGNPLPCLSGCEPVYKAKLALAVSRATAENSSVVGDRAKLREALKTVKRYLDGYTVNVLEMRSQVDAALAATASDHAAENREAK